jgi:hypothetical protein
VSIWRSEDKSFATEYTEDNEEEEVATIECKWLPPFAVDGWQPVSISNCYLDDLGALCGKYFSALGN